MIVRPEIVAAFYAAACAAAVVGAFAFTAAPRKRDGGTDAERDGRRLAGDATNAGSARDATGAAAHLEIVHK